MDNATMMYIVIGLLAIFFIVLMIFSAKTWRVLHMISMFLVFLAAGFFVWFSAAYLKTQDAWRPPANRLAAEIEAADEAIELKKHGAEGEEEDLDSVRGLRAAIEQLRLHRPLMWTGCTPQVRESDIILTIPARAATPADAGEQPPDEEPAAEGEDPADEGEDGGEEAGGEEPAEPAPAAAAGHAIAQSSIVFGFLEGDSPLEGDLAGFKIPRYYLGEFKVVGRTDSTVTLLPTIPLTTEQAARLGENTWTLYDNMPSDSHRVFEGLSEEDLKRLMPPEQVSITQQEYDDQIDQMARFFGSLDPARFPDGLVPQGQAALRNWIPLGELQMRENGPRYTAYLNEYLRDGQKWEEGDPVDRMWTRVTFNAPTVIQVDSLPRDAAEPPLVEDFRSNVVVARRRMAGDEVLDVIIADQNLISTNITNDPNVTTLGQPFALGIAVNDPLKVKSDWEIEELWDRTDGPNAPPVRRSLDQLTADELDAVREAKSIEFDEGEEALVDEVTAAFLTGHKIATKLEDVFVRQLRDYKWYFRESNQQDLHFEHDAKIILQDTVTLLGAAAEAEQQLAVRSTEAGKLQTDLAGFRQEAAAIAGVLNKMEAHQKALTARLSQLYNNNVLLAGRIRTLQTKWKEAILRGEGAPAAADPPPEAAIAAP